MKRLDTEKLEVTYLSGASAEILTMPKCYTLTHSDATGRPFLSIGPSYDTRQTSRLYTKLMRDEVLAELTVSDDKLVLKVYCHVSGGFVFGRAIWRYKIFRSESPLALEAIRYGDRTLFDIHPDLNQIPVYIHFQSNDTRFNKIEQWGIIADYS